MDRYQADHMIELLKTIKYELQNLNKTLKELDTNSKNMITLLNKISSTMD